MLVRTAIDPPPATKAAEACVRHGTNASFRIEHDNPFLPPAVASGLVTLHSVIAETISRAAEQARACCGQSQLSAMPRCIARPHRTMHVSLEAAPASLQHSSPPLQTQASASVEQSSLPTPFYAVDHLPVARCSATSDVRPGALHFLSEDTIRELFFGSVYVRRDVSLLVCSRCYGLNVAHAVGCDGALRDGLCLFCCGCYSKARSLAPAHPPCYAQREEQVGDMTSPTDAVVGCESEAAVMNDDADGGGEYSFDFDRPAVTSAPSPNVDAVYSSQGTGHRFEESDSGMIPGGNNLFPPREGDTTTQVDSLVSKYSDCLLKSDAVYRFDCTKYPTYCVPGPCVRASHDGDVLRREDIPLPSWSCQGVLNDDIAFDHKHAVVSLDKTRIYTVQFLPVRVNDASIDVPICNCERYVADNVKKFLLFDTRITVSTGVSLLQAYVLHLRELMQRQQGSLPRDMLVCIHVQGLASALYIRGLALAAGPTLRSHAQTVLDDGATKAEVGYLSYCAAYVAVILDGSNEDGVAIRRQTYKFTCPAASCVYLKTRCPHLRAVAARIENGRLSDAKFVLAEREADDFLVAQVCAPNRVRSARTHEESMALLHSHTLGPLPLSLAEADASFRDAVYHRMGWQTQLTPPALSCCPGCSVVLREYDALEAEASSPSDGESHRDAPSASGVNQALIPSSETCSFRCVIMCRLLPAQCNTLIIIPPLVDRQY